MLTVYLDQNAWIGLLKAKRGSRDERGCADVLVLLDAGVERGWLRLPLSHVR